MSLAADRRESAAPRGAEREGGVECTVIVVSYNTRELTLEALRSLRRESEGLHLETVVVDNASADGSADAVARECPWARLVRLEENVGFAAANNLAAADARGRYLLLLNPDTVVLDRAVARLLEFARRRPGAGIWGGRTVFRDGRLNPASCWRRMTIWSLLCQAAGLTSALPRSSLFNPEAYGGWDRGRDREVDIVSGCFLLVTRELWERLGGFDRAFFMYGEEADLCLRARALGARPAVTSAATIVHYGGASERVRAEKVVRLMGAKVRLLRRHGSTALSAVRVALLAAWPLGRALGWRAVAAVTRRPAHREAAETWGRVWSARAEWLAEEAR